ncbi:hypothetical protein BGP77_02410 [Saccharospirillum sp. MSK14-1]|nr:hypothetical protein BGP77_02410 [Saccharospirillum sp. MSK14-1]
MGRSRSEGWRAPSYRNESSGQWADADSLGDKKWVGIHPFIQAGIAVPALMWRFVRLGPLLAKGRPRLKAHRYRSDIPNNDKNKWRIQ